jgi:N-acetylglucosaminyldiphosphoundecaprenol N-acetyl-beta-D-mannosaminyltransferase
MECRRSEAVLAAHRGAGLVACDGMPLVWSGRWAGIKTTERVYGPDFLLAFSERARDRGWRSFYFGGAPGVPERLAARLAGRFPGLVTAGSFSPPFGRRLEDESDEAIQLINASQPDIVWVGLSTPKQELWMAHHRERLEASALLGVGAAFDIHTGRVPQAPRWMQRSGLEWVFRLGVEPRRLASRYLRNNPQFISAIIQNPPRHLTEEAG